MTHEQLSDDVYGLIDAADLARRLGRSTEDVSTVLRDNPLPPLGYRRLREAEKPVFIKS